MDYKTDLYLFFDCELKGSNPEVIGGKQVARKKY